MSAAAPALLPARAPATPAAVRPAPAFASLDGLARLLRATATVTVVLVVAALASKLALLDAALALAASGDADLFANYVAVIDADNAAIRLDVAVLVLAVLAGWVLTRATLTAHANVVALDRPRVLRHEPTSLRWLWFVPGLNLLHPREIIEDVVLASGWARAPRTLQAAWFAAVAALVLRTAGMLLPIDFFTDTARAARLLAVQSVLDACSIVLLAASVWLFALLVAQLAEVQHRLRGRQRRRVELAA